MDKLQEWFALTGVQKTALAEQIGVTPATIYNWLNRASYPSGLALRRLHQFTRIPLDDLVPRDNA